MRLSKRWGRGWRPVVGWFKLGQARAADVYADADAPTCRRPRAPELRDAPPFALECPALYMLICHELSEWPSQRLDEQGHEREGSKQKKIRTCLGGNDEPGRLNEADSGIYN